jgi:hypothetical protein
LLDGEAVIGVQSEGRAGKGYDHELQDDDGHNNYDKHFIPSDSFKDIELLMQFSGVDEVEDLHHHKSVEDESEMTGIGPSFQKYSFVIAVASYSIEAAAADSSPDHSIGPLILRMGAEDSAVK